MTTTTPDIAISGPAAPAPEGGLLGGPVAADQPRRVLTIAPPPGKPEAVVRKAAAALAARYRPQLVFAERTIEDHGLTIEATRLRDRLAHAAVSDLERLLLSTPGVPEKLFNDAVEQQLRRERELAERTEDQVKDESVRGIADTIEAASKSLEDSAAVIRDSSTEIRDFTSAIADSLAKMVELVSSAARGRDTTTDPDLTAAPSDAQGPEASPSASGPPTSPSATSAAGDPPRVRTRRSTTKSTRGN